MILFSQRIQTIFYYTICEYIISIFILLFLVQYFYIIYKYPFWNLQPVFHKYDYLRRFYKSPFIVCNKLVSNKFVEKAKIKTFEYIKCDIIFLVLKQLIVLI